MTIAARSSVTGTVPEPEPEKRGGCVEVTQPDPKPDGGEEKPTEELAGETDVVFETNCGSFTVTLDPELGGLSTASFAQLAESGFYEDTFFHRIAPGFVIHDRCDADQVASGVEDGAVAGQQVSHGPQDDEPVVGDPAPA